MAKSARASRVKTNRANIRKKVFGPVEEARLERLSAKLQKVATEPKPIHAGHMDLDTPHPEKSPTTPETENPTAADALMDVDEPDNITQRTTSSKKSRTGRVQKKRRGKAHSTITFPAYRNGRKVNTAGKKKR